LIACAKPPLVPLICSVNVPMGLLREVEIFTVTLVPVVGFGVTDAVTLFGSPLTVKSTEPANPFRRVIVTP